MNRMQMILVQLGKVEAQARAGRTLTVSERLDLSEASELLTRIRNLSIYNAVVLEHQPQSKVAADWCITPARVCQIVKEIRPLSN